MNATIENIMNRRSIRAYEDRRVDRELINTVVKAGICAPSGRNGQSAIVVAVQNREDRDELERLNAAALGKDCKPFYGAPAVLVVLADAESKFAVEDGSLVMANLMNAAYAMGLGSCWIHHAKAVFETDEGKSLLKKWGVTGNYVGVASCIIGYAAEKPAMRPRKDNRIFFVD